MQPIIDSCTKETISGGKVWIFQNANSRDTNRLIAQYLAFKVTDNASSFQIKLHIIYLMNDVLHHCMRKNNDDLRSNLETVAVDMFCSAWISSEQESDSSSRQGKLTKLIKLWQDKSIFSSSTITKLRNVDETWEICKSQKIEEFQQAIALATKNIRDTYENYSVQHEAFVTHAQNSIKGLESKIADLRVQIANAAAAAATTAAAAESANKNWVDHEAGIPPPPQPKKSGRGSRWDTGSDGQSMAPHHPQGMPDFTIPPAAASVVLPDLSRPPPGFGGPPINMHPGGAQTNRTPFNDSALIPTLPYHDLPAGLMVPLIKMEDSGYKFINPKELRLPPPLPPTERLLAALDQFYAPPSHDRPRDPEGWEMLGLYEWSRAKTSAIKRKADDIESGRRERSPTASPERFEEEILQQRRQQNEHSKPLTTSADRPRKKYRERSRSRTRSRTRSRSRESTPDRSRGNRARRSPSPEGSYTLPSYLTKRSPSPERESSPPARSSSNRDRRRKRSPTPPETAFKGFGGNSSSGSAAQQLDSSNKGHQMLQKMGWKGSGLGTSEGGIVEPISGGEVRDRQDQYRGMGHGTDPFEAFRKSKAGSFYTRMKERDRDRDVARKSAKN